MDNVHAQRSHLRNRRWRWRRAAHGDLDRGHAPLSYGGGMVRQSNEHRGRRAEMRDALTLDEVPHNRWIDLAQDDVRGSGRGSAPREAPAIAVEHGQCPEVDAV